MRCLQFYSKRIFKIPCPCVIHRLKQNANVQPMPTLLHTFQQNMKSESADSILEQHKSTISQCAYSIIVDEYTESLRSLGTVSDNGDGTFKCGWHTTTNATCSCHLFMCFRLPCRHIFCVRNLSALPAFDTGLVHPRWYTSEVSIDTGSTNSQHSRDIGTETVPPLQQTQAQRYKAAMTVFTSMASVVSQLPPSRFFECLLWLGQIDSMVRDGTWENSILISSTSSAKD